MSERLIEAGAVELCCESFGDDKDPTLLLIMGATASMVWWPAEFCRRLAARGYHVIRYDNRDTGRSTSYPPGHKGYHLEDLAADAFAVLDGYGVRAAHLVGMSLGGMLAQIAALRRPERVRTLTLVSSQPLTPDDYEAPPMDPAILAHFETGATLDWSDRAATVAHVVEDWRLMTGRGRSFDEPATRALAAADFDRAPNLQTTTNHALLAGDEVRDLDTKDLRLPTLIVHGSDDPALPYAHALALARLLPHARLVTLAGAGHELNAADWDTIVEAIARHAAGS